MWSEVIGLLQTGLGKLTHSEESLPTTAMQSSGPESLLWDHLSPGPQPHLILGEFHCLLYLSVLTVFFGASSCFVTPTSTLKSFPN